MVADTDAPPQREGIKVGVYFDVRNPQQWRQDPARLYGFVLEACEEAEHLGADSLWFSEHHLFEDDYLSNPLTLAAAAAARTVRPRIGTAIVIAPIHHPVEIAEQSAAVDLISNGRLDLGLGTGYRIPEFELYGTTLERKYGRTDDTTRELRKLWGPGGIRPVPVQDPLPIWMGYQGPQGARRAGLLGEGLLSADGALWAPYAEGLSEGGHSLSSARMSGGCQAWATEDPERDWPMVSEHLAHQLNSYRRHMVEGTGQPAPRPVDVDRLVNEQRSGPLGGFTYGTPDTVAKALLDKVGDAPVGTIFFWASIGGMPEDVVMANINTICTKVAPLLAQGD